MELARIARTSPRVLSVPLFICFTCFFRILLFDLFCVQKVNKFKVCWEMKMEYLRWNISHFCYISPFYWNTLIWIIIYTSFFQLIYFLRNNSMSQFHQFISKIFCNNYHSERISPSLIVRKPKVDFDSLNLKSAISHFFIWVL